MKNNKISAFTLVELIVVITILAVLATVAFISFQGYTSSSRDSVRLADLKNISKSFELNRTKGVEFPLPDKKIDITSSGTIFQYQGELSQNILNSDLNIFDGGVDPLTRENYGYAVNTARNKFQIIGFLENSENISNISTNKAFADNSDKYVKSSGNDLGILLDSSTNEIIVQSGSLVEIDIENTTENFSIVQDKQIKTVLSTDLLSTLKHRINPIESCNNILLNGESRGNGTYLINPTGVSGEEFEVYCDMETQGGGWTLFYANNGRSDSKIKQSYVQMRENIENKAFTYNISNFDSLNLAGLVDYNLLIDKGAHKVMIQDYNALEYEIIADFDSPDSLDWALSDQVLGPLSTTCVEIPNNGHMSLYINTSNYQNKQYLELSHIMNHRGSSWGVAHDSYPCNGYTGREFSHFGFYSSVGVADEYRARASYTTGNSYRDNLYRYYIK